MALKRELQMMSAENRLKRSYDNTDEDNAEMPLLYPFDADQVTPDFVCDVYLTFLLTS